jgi:hypothetical protein
MLLNMVPVEKGAHLQSLHKAPVDEAPTKFPNGAPTENDVCLLSPPPHVLPDPQKGAPLTELLQREMLPFQSPHNYLLIPSQQLPRSPNRPLWRETPFSRAFFYIFSTESLLNEPPSIFPNRVPMEREDSSPEPMVYHLFLSVTVP